LLCGAVLIVAVMNLARMGEALVSWKFLETLLPVSPAYLAVTGLVWGTLGLLAAWRLWQGQLWASWFGLALIISFSVYYWVDRLFLPGYPGRNSNWLFSAGMNLLLIAISVWILARPKAKRFFEATDERRLKDSTSA
jgi:uncharacterized membrane protein (DUF2068 family)